MAFSFCIPQSPLPLDATQPVQSKSVIKLTEIELKRNVSEFVPLTHSYWQIGHYKGSRIYMTRFVSHFSEHPVVSYAH